VSIISPEEADTLYDIKRAAIEWRDARRAIFTNASTPEMWRRLADAEDALMRAVGESKP